MTPPVVYMAQGELTSPQWCNAFAHGCGGKIVDTTSLLPGDVALFGSPKLWYVVDRMQKEKRTFYYGDHGYFRKGDYYRITRNAFQHDGKGQAGPDRFEKLGSSFRPRPWKKDGQHVLVCPPGPVFAALHGFNADMWLDAVISKLQIHTDRPVRVRPKPMRKRGARPLAADLEDCWALVTWRSNVCVEALAAGVPVFPLGKCASSHLGREDLGQIEKPFYPGGRDQFFWNLAANQWTLGEIHGGQAWDILNRPRAGLA